LRDVIDRNDTPDPPHGCQHHAMITASTGASAGRRSGLAAGLVVTVAAVGVLSALLVRSACVDPGPPVARPDAGTDRAGYCGVVHGPWLWLLLLAAPVVVTAGAALLARGRARWLLVAIATAAACGALANVFIVHSLEFAYTI
jgi:hypothetical protein